MRFAKMHGVVVVNDLPDQFPTDINYDHYVKEAQASGRCGSASEAEARDPSQEEGETDMTKNAMSGVSD